MSHSLKYDQARRTHCSSTVIPYRLLSMGFPVAVKLDLHNHYCTYSHATAETTLNVALAPVAPGGLTQGARGVGAGARDGGVLSPRTKGSVIMTGAFERYASF